MAEQREDEFVLTRAGYEALQRELQDLEVQREQRQADYVDVNSDTEPATEEAAYFEARTEKEHVEERIGHLKLVLEQARISEDDPHPLGVDPGEQVVVWDFAENRERVFKLVSGEETVNARDEIKGDEVSTDSPVGRALIGKGVGDVIEVDVPDGKTRYAVRHITHINH